MHACVACCFASMHRTHGCMHASIHPCIDGRPTDRTRPRIPTTATTPHLITHPPTGPRPVGGRGVEGDARGAGAAGHAGTHKQASTPITSTPTHPSNPPYTPPPIKRCPTSSSSTPSPMTCSPPSSRCGVACFVGALGLCVSSCGVRGMGGRALCFRLYTSIHTIRHLSICLILS